MDGATVARVFAPGIGSVRGSARRSAPFLAQNPGRRRAFIFPASANPTPGPSPRASDPGQRPQPGNALAGRLQSCFSNRTVILWQRPRDRKHRIGWPVIGTAARRRWIGAPGKASSANPTLDRANWAAPAVLRATCNRRTTRAITAARANVSWPGPFCFLKARPYVMPANLSTQEIRQKKRTDRPPEFSGSTQRTRSD